MVANEDEEYPIGQVSQTWLLGVLQLVDNPLHDLPGYLKAIASKLDGVLVDDDGSETLYLVLGGISSRTKLLGVDESSMLYLGNGEWSVEASAVAALTVTPVKNYSGQNPFPFMTLTAISQEVDGDQSSSDLWTITFDVLPVIDGFKDWAPAVTVTEEDNEINNVGISLAAARDYTLEDSDGSEKVINFKFDLSNVLESAGIDDQLKVLSGNTSSDVSNLVDTYIAGVFEFDGSIITVLPENVAGVTIAAQLFKDSNQDFAIPVTALVEDSATINGSQEVVSKIESTELKVNLVGTADVPTVSAGDIVGCQRIQMDIGGETTDTDVELGRSQSESIAYLIQPINMRSLPGYRIVDSAQNNIGFAAGAMTWILPYDEMKEAEENGGLFFYTIDQGEYITRRLQNDTAAPVSAPTPTPAPIPAEFKLWVIAKENDGDEAFDTANFYVTYWQGECDGGFDDPVAPLPPILSIGPNNGVEDTDLSLSISATPDPADTTNPTVSIVLSNIPEGFTIAGKVIPGFYYNHATGTHSAYADYFAVGNVVITPPKDFAGTVSIQAEAIAVNSFFISNSSGEQSASLTFDPVADGVAITIPGIENGGVEMQQLPLPIELALLDTDGSERLGDAVFVEVCFDATLMPQYTRVQPQDGDASVAGVSVAGYYRVPVGEVNGLSMQPSDYWHGPCDVSVVAVSIENDDDEDGDHIMMATEMTFTPYIVSVPTPPLVNVPDTVSGEEDTAIFLPGLSASLVDTVDINGKERLSAIISNVPLNSIFNHGSNSGEGRWAIPTDKLGGLYITPPPQYAGTFQMTLTAVAFDVATGTEASTSADMVITVKPVADTFLMLAKNIDVVQGAVSGVFLTIHMDDTTGSLEGELPPEILHLTFNDVPTGVWFQASAGGTMTDNGIYWNFEGSEDEANSIVVHTSADTPIDIHNITVFGFTQDGDSTLQKNVRDSFLVRVLNPASAGRALQRQNHYGAPSPWQRSLGSRSGCGAETSIVWESQPGLITLDDYPVTIDVQGNTSVTFTLDSSSLLRSSVSNWAAIMYPSTPHGKTVCEAVAIDLESKYQGNCYNGGSTAYLLVNAKGAPDSADNAYIPTTCKGLYPKPDAKTVMVELSIPCHPCSAQDEFGTTTNNGMFGGESGNNGNVGDGFDDDSFTDDALYDDDGLEELEDGFLEDVEDVEFSKRQRLRWLQQEDLQVNEDGTVVWTEQDAMVPATLDRDTLKLLMQSKNPKYRSLQEEQQQQQEEQGADGSSSSDADTLGGTSKISLNLELVGGDGILRQQKSGAASTRSTTFVGWWWTIASVVVSTTVCCLFSAILF